MERILLWIFCCAVSVIVFSHEKISHEKFKADISTERIQKMNQEYVNTIKPIFKNKCFDCHSEFTRFPWYYKLPIVHSLIDHDIRDGRKHLDFSHDFPFGGHGNIQEDLEAIRKVVLNKTMPPFRYKILHWHSGLSNDETLTILKWVQESKGHISLEKK